MPLIFPALAVLVLTLGFYRLPLLPPPVAAITLSSIAAASVFALRPRIALVLTLLALQLWNLVHDGMQWQRARLLPGCERTALDVVGTVRGLPESRQLHGETVYRVLLEVDAIRPARCAGPGRLQLYLGGFEAPAPGQVLRLQARLRVPWGLGNGVGADGQRSLFLADVHGVGSASTAVVIGASGAGLRAPVDHSREELSRAISRCLHGASAALLPALLVGDRRAMTDEHWQRLREFGITHLLVISGMHISMVSLLGIALGLGAVRIGAALRWGWLRRAALPVATVALAGVYVALSGWAIPAVRALLMVSLATFALAFGRGRDGFSIWSAALLLVLLLQPRAVLAAGFWLSFGAVAVLIAVSAMPRPEGALRSLVYVQVVMTTAMVPVGFFWFGGASAAGAALNLVAVPLVTIWVLPLGLLGVAAWPISVPVADFLWVIAAAPLERLWDLVLLLTQWQPGGIYLEQPALPAGALAFLGLGVSALIVPVSKIRAAALAMLLPLAASRATATQQMELRFFDVGQGTAVLARDGARAVLYDTGPSLAAGGSRAESVVLPYLKRVGVRELDLLVLSHLDSDHAGGVRVLESALNIRERWAGPPDLEGYRRCRPGARFRTGAVLVTSLSLAHPGDSDNDQSCVVMLELAGLRVLLPGDIGRVRERELVAYWGAQLRADVLLLPHHGSNTSASELFLRTVGAAESVATTARGNRFGHPAEPVRGRVQRSGARLWDSARHGVISFQRVGGHWVLRPWRHGGRPFWRKDPPPSGARSSRDPFAVILRPSQED